MNVIIVDFHFPYTVCTLNPQMVRIQHLPMTREFHQMKLVERAAKLNIM